MTNKEASFLLGAYRANGMDSGDPEFAEALAQAGRDPALKGWFEDQQRFDAGIAAAMQGTPAPLGLKARIIAGGRVSQPERWWTARRVWAVAAMVALFAGAGLFYRIESRPEGWDEEAMGALSQLVSGETKFDAQSGSVTELQQWLRRAGSPTTGELPTRLKGLASLGCKTISWHGHAISLICFHGSDGEMVHLAMVDKGALSNPPPEGTPEYAERDGWRTASWSQGDMAMMLITRGPESQLRAILAIVSLL